MLPADSHVHTEWSWDTAIGSMERTCEQALRIGLPALAFTDHADYTPWTVIPDSPLDQEYGASVASDGTFTPPLLDVDGYLECLQRCRDRFPELRILGGVELGEAHWHPEQAAKLLAHGRFDRVLGSQHSLAIDGRFFEPGDAYGQRPAAEVIRTYLAEVTRLVVGSDVFAVLAHIDYPVRYWPDEAGPFDPSVFEDEFRHALRALAAAGRALEVNTRLPLDGRILRWWYEEGGEAVSFGSDAHDPLTLAHGFADAAARVEAQGFRPGRHPYDFWVRSRPARRTGGRVASAVDDGES